MKHSDNLTDLVEHLEENKDKEQENSANKSWEVKSENGEIIKLDDRFTRDSNK